MARRTPANPPQEDSRIVDIDVSAEMQNSFLEYAYSVIYSRALPDARDGLKPVQRRILYQMAQMGLRPDRGHVKSARVVGDVMGKLHPHGDSAIYDALVRMAQPFTLRLPLIDGHGNFGSLDDGPAAPRYTEARLAPAAMVMTADLDSDVVDLVPNYDNSLTQPQVLPSALPNLLVNGASGIAVGMATNMPPHNLVEVIAAARHLIAHPDADLDALMRFIPGPDLPEGGKIIGLDGIRDAYAGGRGTFRSRATTRIENITARRRGIVVTELPYLVGPERVIAKITEAVQSKKLQGISAVTDLTDHENGMRLVIEVKSAFNPDAVLTELFRLTPLEESFGINNVALVDGQPRTLGLRELLQVYVDHRIDVVQRRTSYQLGKQQDRLHLVEGLLIAIADIDEVIAVIRSSDDAETARTRLISVFDLTQAQAEYILELRLRRLTKFSRIELEAERDELATEIERLQAILADPAVLRNVVSDELAQVAATHGTPRRTVLLESGGAAIPAAAGARRREPVDLEVADSPCWVLLSATGLLARTGDAAAPAREGQRSAHDALRSAVPANVRGEVAAVTSAGRMVRMSVVEIPGIPATQGPPSLSGGVPVAEMLILAPGEQVVGLASLHSDSAASGVLTLGTASGVIKRVTPDWPGRADDWEVISLKDGDQVVGVGSAGDEDQVVFVTSDGQLLRFAASAVRPQGRGAGGMAGIRLAAGARVITVAVIASTSVDQALVTTAAASSQALPGTAPGSVKTTPLAAYPSKGRATAGVRVQRFLRGEDSLYLAAVAPAPVRAVGSGGQPIPLPEEDPRRDSSGTAVTTPIAGLG
ncbi:MAG: DNA topoisomerase (ATP-hydrolyzing) subunit A [Beutenbergiaceae bacterium]